MNEVCAIAGRARYVKTMRRIIVSLSLAGFTAACGLSDLRPEPLIKNQLPPNAEQLGRQWLERAVAAHGGPLKPQTTLSFWMRDDWPSALLRLVAMPWDDNKELLRIDVVVGTDDGRLIFMEGDHKGTGWGLQNWVSYRFDKVGAPKFDPADDVDDTIKFWIPTLAYFPLLPWRIGEADYVRYLGEVKIGGRTYAKVFLTWGDPKPQDTIDQYIVWIDTETNLLAGTRYTVRDMMASIVGTMKYSDYRDVDGFKLPFSVNGVEDLASDDTESHHMRFERIAFDEGVTAKDLMPKPELRAVK